MDRNTSCVPDPRQPLGSYTFLAFFCFFEVVARFVPRPRSPFFFRCEDGASEPATQVGSRAYAGHEHTNGACRNALRVNANIFRRVTGTSCGGDPVARTWSAFEIRSLLQSNSFVLGHLLVCAHGHDKKRTQGRGPLQLALRLLSQFTSMVPKTVQGWLGELWRLCGHAIVGDTLAELTTVVVCAAAAASKTRTEWSQRHPLWSLIAAGGGMTPRSVRLKQSPAPSTRIPPPTRTKRSQFENHVREHTSCKCDDNVSVDHGTRRRFNNARHEQWKVPTEKNPQQKERTPVARLRWFWFATPSDVGRRELSPIVYWWRGREHVALQPPLLWQCLCVAAILCKDLFWRLVHLSTQSYSTSPTRKVEDVVAQRSQRLVWAARIKKISRDNQSAATVFMMSVLWLTLGSTDALLLGWDCDYVVCASFETLIPSLRTRKPLLRTSVFPSSPSNKCESSHQSRTCGVWPAEDPSWQLVVSSAHTSVSSMYIPCSFEAVLYWTSSLATPPLTVSTLRWRRGIRDTSWSLSLSLRPLVSLRFVWKLLLCVTVITEVPSESLCAPTCVVMQRTIFWFSVEMV